MRPGLGGKAMMVALYLSLIVPLRYLVAGNTWIGWYVGFGGLVFAVGAVGRAAGLKDRTVGLCQILLLPLAQVVAFASDVAWLWALPNRAVAERFWEMGQGLGRTFLVDVAPLAPSEGLCALLGISGGLLAWAFDWYTVTLRAAAATGMFALLVLVVTVAFVRSGLPVLALAPSLVCYLGLLAATSPVPPAWIAGAGRWRLAARATPAALVAGAAGLGLAASLAPGLAGGALVRGGENWTIPYGSQGGARQVVGADSPLVDVSRDLREQANYEVLRYATAATEPVYLRLTALSEFDGAEWRHVDGAQIAFEAPTNLAWDGALAMDAPVAPLGAVEPVAVQLKALDSAWLPAPYLALDLWGTSGPLYLDQADRTLQLGWPDGAEAGYTVLWGTPGNPASAAAAAAGGGAGQTVEPGAGAGAGVGAGGSVWREYQTPQEGASEEFNLAAGDETTYTVGQYRFGPGHGDRAASGDPLYGPLEDAARYLALPPGLPAAIGLTARQAVAGAAADPSAQAVPGALAYAQGAALVAYFQEAGFEYSLDAPAEPADGGDQGQVIARFLEDKSGYCVHYAAAMTLMARELGIPARLAVGYMPGQRVGSAEPGEWGLAADGREIGLYSVGADRLHAWPELYIEGLGWTSFEPTVGASQRAAGVQASSAAPGASPSPSRPSAQGSTPGASAAAPPGGRPAGGAASVAGWACAMFGALALAAAAPGGWRWLLRRRRWRAGLAGAWDEVCASAADLGLGPPLWRTPAGFAAEVGAQLRAADQAPAAAALEALTAAVEQAAYAPPAPAEAPAAGAPPGAGALPAAGAASAPGALPAGAPTAGEPCGAGALPAGAPAGGALPAGGSAAGEPRGAGALPAAGAASAPGALAAAGAASAPGALAAA
ncbi:MAG: DUF3488 and transglutaminase-like domain-containing protein, partial [Bifidobacteriaceae bacterium]|nr:DUF3488 and transglutaminase-like domain-containing protein [Bifidobacteriaceae bacterium]